MRKLLSLIFAVTAIVAGARQVSPDEAAAIASDFLNSSSVQRAPGRVTVQRAKPANHQAEAPFYVFNAEDNNGFVIVSGDDRARKILGYSDNGAFDFNNLPPQLAAMLEQYAGQIEKLPASATADPSWSAPAVAPASTDGVLLETANWGQGYPYNLQCPEVDGQQCVTGCVATAMAIVMNYHQWPQTCRSFGKYEWDDKLLSTNFEEYKFDWSTTETAQKLMSATGLSVDMNYGIFESSANMLYIGHELAEKFKYSYNCCSIQSDNFSTDEWLELILDNLRRGLPIIYGAGSHCFVIDGYSTNDDYHINWGWDGENNGYFSYELIKGYNVMVINIEPDKNEYPCGRVFTDELYRNYLEYNTLNVLTDNIVKNTPFVVLTPMMTFPIFADEEVAIALTDKSGNIKEIISSRYERYVESENRRVSHGVGGFTCEVKKSDIDYTDRIQLICRTYGENEWKPVHGTINTPTYVNISNTVPRYASIRYDIDDDIDFYHYSSSKHLRGKGLIDKIPVGNAFPFHATSKRVDGYIKVTFEGPQVYGNKTVLTKSSDLSWNLSITHSSEYLLNAEYIKYADTQIVDVSVPGSLQNLIGQELCERISHLIVNGNINALDIYYIRDNMPGIRSLDLSNANIASCTVEGGKLDGFPYDTEQKTDFFPDYGLTGLWMLENICLPRTLKGIGFSGMAEASELKSIELPESVEFIDLNAFFSCSSLENFICHNPVPVLINDCVFQDTKYRDSLVLYVPEGSKEQYEQAPVWQDFYKIEEIDFDAIPNVKVDWTNTPADVYNINGILLRKVASDSYIESLPAGIYIISGVKTLIR